MNNRIQYIIIGILIGGIAVWIFTSSDIKTGGNRMINSNQSMMQNAGNIDAHFIQQMIPHHEVAIVMSKLALKKAQRPDVKKLAQDIIASQSQEIDQMKKRYKEWFGKDIPSNNSDMSDHGMRGNTGMQMGMMGEEEDMKKLEESDDFDREFVEQMIPHHQSAVMMASMLQAGTNRDEMKKLAKDIISAQNKEIEMMRKWLSEWN